MEATSEVLDTLFSISVESPPDGAFATSTDIENCCILFLGRKPSRESLLGLGKTAVGDAVRDLLLSDEFKGAVLPPLLLREPMPHILLDGAPALTLIDWAQRRLPLTPSTRLSIAGARTWSQLLELLLADATFAALSEELVATGIESILRSRLENEPLYKLKRSVVGVVDSSSAFDVRGWAVDLCEKSSPVMLEFFADGAFLGSVVCREPRPDVQDVVGGEGNYGFTFKISASHRAGFAGGRTLTVLDAVSKTPIGQSMVVHSDAAQTADIVGETLKELGEVRKALGRIEARLPEIGRIASVPIEAYNEYWERFYRPSPDVLFEQGSRAKHFLYQPLVSIVVPVWCSDTRLLRRAIKSVLAQTYDNWELIVSDDASDRDELRSLFRSYANEPRIRYIEGADRAGIAVNTNRGIEAANGEYVAFLDHDDELAPDALFQVVLQVQKRRYALLYSDEDRIEDDEYGRCIHHTPFFKPDFDLDLLRSLNYVCHLVVVRRDLLTEVNGLRSGFEGAQDHDMLLRLTEQVDTADILHLPRILYHWRVTPGSVSRTPQLGDTIQENIVATVNGHLERSKLHARAEAHHDPVAGSRRFATRVRWELPDVAPMLSILIATKDRVDLLRPCIESVMASLPHYPGRCEVLIVDNDSSEPATREYLGTLSSVADLRTDLRVMRFRGPFNWSAINNAAALEAKGEVLLFLNNDTVVLTRDWCVELVANAIRLDVGAVGARLLYADGTIQHAGVLLGIEGVAGHECVGQTPGSGGYFGRSQLLRNAAAVTGACLAIRRSVFDEVGGFDEVDLKVAFNDVDLCMKLRKAGYRVIYDPFAVLYHLESKSRGREISEAQQARHRSEAIAFRARWSGQQMTDPFYNPHFERFARPFERLRPPPAMESAIDTDAPA